MTCSKRDSLVVIVVDQFVAFLGRNSCELAQSSGWLDSIYASFCDQSCQTGFTSHWSVVSLARFETIPALVSGILRVFWIGRLSVRT